MKGCSESQSVKTYEKNYGRDGMGASSRYMFRTGLLAQIVQQLAIGIVQLLQL